MGDAGARDEVMDVVQKYSHELDADDLRAIANELVENAEKWEALE